MANKILIIQPSHYRSRTDKTICKSAKRTVIPLTLPYLAALTPSGWEINLVDEQLSEIDFQADTDLVALTAWTINSFRAYDIADRFRKRGVAVIMGGPHISFYAKEAADHCDALGIGEGERIWPQMLDDALRGCLKKIYRSEAVSDLGNFPLPRYDLLNFQHYRSYKTFTIQASRGCPFSCEFCSERFYLGEKYRYRPVQDVIDEIKSVKARNFLFADSNFAGSVPHAMELMEALIPLKVRWSCLWSAYLCRDRKFLDLAKRSGLLHVNIGFESIQEKSLLEMNKTINKVKQYEEILSNLARRGISYSLNFIFGTDSEEGDVFGSTLSFLCRNKVPVAYFNILTPHRGTPLHDRMQSENRIIAADDIGRWPGVICYIQPKACSPLELEAKVRKMYLDFYSLRSILKRLPFPRRKDHVVSWILNFSQRKMHCAPDARENFDDF